jgi:acid phosphatase
MYSSEVSSYQEDLRNAFQDLMIDNGVDMYLAGHIHWYERLFPLTRDGKVDQSAVVDKDTYKSSKESLVHVVNGQAGNIESHSTLGDAKVRYTHAKGFCISASANHSSIYSC